jgi:hypothetical protein
MSRTVSSLRGAVVRLSRALLGAWLIVGPFVGIYARETDALVVVLVLLAAAYGFAAGRAASDGAACLAPIVFDGLTLLAVLWIASASRELFGAAVAFRLHQHLWVWPALILLCFWLAEFLAARKNPARA